MMEHIYLVNEVLLIYYMDTPSKHYPKCKLVTKQIKNHWYKKKNTDTVYIIIWLKFIETVSRSIIVMM